jgi:hypothetical protein
MNILKAALLGTLRIIFFGSLKAAIFGYTVFLSAAAFTGAAHEDNGHVGGTASHTAPAGLDHSSRSTLRS